MLYLHDKINVWTQISSVTSCITGYNDTGEAWRSDYETSTFEADLEDLYVELKPLYEQLHAYVRRKLMSFYGKENFPESGHIPAHLFGKAINTFGDIIPVITHLFKRCNTLLDLITYFIDRTSFRWWLSFFFVF